MEQNRLETRSDPATGAATPPKQKAVLVSHSLILRPQGLALAANL